MFDAWSSAIELQRLKVNIGKTKLLVLKSSEVVVKQARY